MGVLAGRIPGKAKEGSGEGMLGRLLEALRKFAGFAENFGLAIAEREIEARLNKKAF